MKKFLLLLLALAMTVTVFACGGKDDNGHHKPSQTTGEEEYPLPDMKWDGKDYRIGYNGYDIEFYTMLDDPNDPIDYALWLRNETVQDRFDVKIEPVNTGGTGYHGHVQILMDNILTDSALYDVTSSFAQSSGALTMAGCLVDLNQLEYTNLDADYWIGTINDNFVIEGRIYNASGATNVTTITYTYGMFMNRTMAETLWIDSEQTTHISDEVFAKIRSKEWTIDYFSNVVSMMYSDIDDEPGPSWADRYGFNAETKTNLDVYNFAFDLPMMNTKDTDELLEFVFDRDKASIVADKLIDLYWNNEGSLIDSVYIDNFVGGRCLFTTAPLSDCFNYFRTMEDDYIILPYPMLDEEQGAYYTGLMGDQYVLGIPTSCKNLDFASFVTEAMNIEADNYMVPAYLTQSLQGKFATDETALYMLDLLMEGRRQDFGTLFQTSLDNVSCWMRWVVASKENNMAQYIDDRFDYMGILIDSIIEQYRKNAQ